MKNGWQTTLICLLIAIMCVSNSYTQGTTAPISGIVTDPSGAVVNGAKVTIKNSGTGAQYTVITKENGNYVVPALPTGMYSVKIEITGFKKVEVQNVKLDVGTPATVNAMLEIGGADETVVVTGGADVLQTQSPQVSTTLVGRQIIETPQTSRDALDLVLNMPGTNTPGRPRTSTINGLPKGAINITMDGLNVQDNMGKSGDGFFTYVRPRIDAIEEVSVSTSNPGAESAGEGAVQIKFVTKGGTNEYHGGLYWYHRNPALNANYYFNNNAGQPRSRILLNQYGFKFGGPISVPKLYDGREKSFFFVNYEEFRIPEQNLRTRTILKTSAQAGIFKYNVAGVEKSVDLFKLAGADSADPTISGVLGKIRQSTSLRGAILTSTDPNTEPFAFINSGNQSRYFPTVRLDFKLTDKHHLENIYNYQFFTGKADFLNGNDPAFPGSDILGVQGSNRFTNSTALRSTLTNSLVNEFRFGFTGGRVEFSNNVNAGMFADTLGYALNINSALGLQNYYTLRSGSSRTVPVLQFSDSLSWTKGTHNFSFGVNHTRITSWAKNQSDGVARQVNFGLATGDPADGLFTAANFPGSEAGQRAQAGALYSLLTGRITSVTGSTALDENTNKYKFAGERIQRARMNEYGTFVQDNWRLKQNLTFNLGLRWEIQMPFVPLNSSYSYATYESVFGVSGPGNLFKPGVFEGSVPQYTKYEKGKKAYNTDWNSFAPSFGFAWTPRFSNNSVSNFLFGEGGQTVLRGGYSLAYNREGLGVFGSIYGANPGSTISASRDVTFKDAQALTPGALLRNGVPSPPSGLADAPSYPLLANDTGSINAFSPTLQTPYVQSWSFGFQREISRDTAVEFRYVGNRARKLWRQYNVNEINVLENGFLDDFKRAQGNFAASVAANPTDSKKWTFAHNPLLPGSVELPVISKLLKGSSSSYTNTALLGFLDANRPNSFGFANTLYSTPAIWGKRADDIPSNFFVVNPTVGTRGSFLVDNGGYSSYDSLQVELRRRLSKGLLVQGSYTFAKGMTDMYASSGTNFTNYISLRHPGLSKTLSPFNITHGLKATWVYELPFGKGKAFGGSVGKLGDLAIGGWEFHGVARVQTGSPNNLGNIKLVGMTAKELQDSIKIRRESNNIVYWLPQDIIDNTRKAFGSISKATPTGRYIAPANYQEPLAYAGVPSGFSNLIVYGPSFARYDLTAMKRFKITETKNFELRAEFLNAFNHTNFLLGNAGNDVNFIGVGGSGFGQTGTAYQDLSTTNDPGGRLIQFVLRFNF